VPPCRRTMSLLTKSWNPNSSTEWQPATQLVLGSLPPQSTETQHSPLWLQENPHAPSKSNPLTEGIKEVICNTTYPEYPSLRNIPRAPGQKPQNSNYRAQEI
jgi:hypothetical protein